MSKIIPKNRDPQLSEFGSNDLVLNTNTGDLFAKANNRIFKILGRNQLEQTINDTTLSLLSSSQDTNTTGSAFPGFNTVGGFYGIVTTSPLTGSNVSLHGGIPFDYGQPIPNSPYIKTNGGFDILMDNADVYNNSSFRIFKDTGVPGLGTELLKLDNEGNLTVSGSILTSGSGGNISGSLTINGNLIVSGTSTFNDEVTIAKLEKLYFDGPSGMHIYSEGTAPGENQIILAKTNNLRILNQAHGKDIEFGTENASGTAKTPLILSGSGDSIFGGNITVTGNIVSTGDIVAQRYIVSSSVTHLTQSFSSGSTIFGDTADDTHQFTGNITASGNISSSGTIVGSNLSGTNTGDQNISNLAITGSDVIFANITASGNISSSGNIYATKFGNNLEIIDSNNVATIAVDSAAGVNNSGLKINVDGVDRMDFQKGALPTKFNVHTLFDASITASGDISSSGTITGNSIVGTLATAAQTNITSVGTLSALTVSGDITANGNIVGDDGTDITNIRTIECDEIVHDGDTDTKILFGTDSITFTVGNLDMITLSESSDDTITFGNSGTDLIVPGNLSSSGTITGNSIVGTIGTATQGTIDHDSLANFVAAEHYRWDTDISSTATINAANIPTLNQSTTGNAATATTAQGITGATDGDVTITSDGNVTVKLDADNDETTQTFKVTDNADATVFHVTEAGAVFLSGDFITNSTSDNDLTIETDGNMTFTIDRDNDETSQFWRFINYNKEVAQITEEGSLTLGDTDGTAVAITTPAHDNGAGSTFTLSAGDATAGQTDKGGGILAFYGGQGTGTGATSEIRFYTAPASGSSGTTLQSHVKAATITNDSKLRLDGGTLQGPTNNDLLIASDGNITFRIDEDNDETGQKFAFQNNASTEIASLNESGDLQIDGDLTVSGRDINSATDGDLRFNSDNDMSFMIDVDGDGTNSFLFFNSSSEIANLDKDGNLQIDGDLTVTGGDIVSGTDGTLRLASDTSMVFKIDADNDGTNTFDFMSHNTTVASLDESGNLQLDGGLTVDGDTSTFSSANADDPLIIIKNTANDATGARLRFVKDKGAAGANNDDIGLIEFYGDDANQDNILFAKITAEVEQATNGQEGGRLSFGIATHDGEFQNGLILSDGSQEDEIDVTIGFGSNASTQINGSLAVSNELDISSDLKFSTTDSGPQHITDANDNAVITIDENGITALNAVGNLDIGSFDFRAQTFTSDVSTGTAPFTVSSTTAVANLQAATATALHTARTINGVSFDGSANITVTAAGSTLSDTVTVAKGGTGATSFADKSVIITQDSGTDTLAAVAMSTNGQLLIGGTSGPAVAVPTGGDGLTVTVGDGTLEYDLDAALTTVTSILATDLKIGEDDETKIDFETADEIHFYAANVEQVYLADNIFGPQSDSDVDLGSNSVRWKDAYIDTITTTGDINASGNVVSEGNIQCSGSLFHAGDTDTKLSFGNNSIRLTAGNTVVADFDASLILNNVPLSNKFNISGTNSGSIGGGDVVYIGGGSTTIGKVHYYKSDGEWGLTDADAAATATGWLAVALGTDPDVDGMLLRGMVTLAGDIVGTEALGSILYLDTATTGDVTTVAPSGTDDIVRVVGYAVSTGNDNKIWFDPSTDWVEHA